MTRLAVLAAWTLVAIVAVFGAVVAYLDGDSHWLLSWLMALAVAAHGWAITAQGARIDRLDHISGAWRRQDPEAWRRDEEPTPIEAGDVIEHIASGRRGVVDELEQHRGTDGAWVALDDAPDVRWVPLTVLRHAPPDTDTEETDDHG